MYDSVENCVGDYGFSDDLEPRCDGQLTCDDCRPTRVPVFDDFEEVGLLLPLQRGQPEVVDDEQIGFCHPVEEFDGRAFYARQFQSCKEFLHIVICDAESLTASLIPESRGEKRLSAPRRAGNNYRFTLTDVIARQQPCEQHTVYSPCGIGIDFLSRRPITERSILQEALTAIFTPPVGLSL